jgi:acyl-coenzyme A synthetase/AMP-(fatty) acid ligase
LQPDNEPCIGEVALVPIMLGASSTLLNADHDSVYFKGMPFFRGRQLRRHGDIFERLVGGFYKAHGRADDTMNLGGIKTSAVEIERVCNKAHEAVLETAAIGVQGPNGGPDQLVIVAVLKKGNQIGLDELQKLFSLAVSSKLNPLFKVLIYSVPCCKHTCACLIFIVTCDKSKTSLSCWWS